jgi:hypothetical protein
MKKLILLLLVCHQPAFAKDCVQNTNGMHEVCTGDTVHFWLSKGVHSIGGLKETWGTVKQVTGENSALISYGAFGQKTVAVDTRLSSQSSNQVSGEENVRTYLAGRVKCGKYHICEGYKVIYPELNTRTLKVEDHVVTVRKVYDDGRALVSLFGPLQRWMNYGEKLKWDPEICIKDPVCLRDNPQYQSLKDGSTQAAEAPAAAR